MDLNRAARPGLLAMALVALCAVATLTASEAEATVLRDLKLADLAAQADAIVVGRVVSQKSLRDPGHAQIWTDVRIDVETAVKGKVGAELTVRQQGGQIGDELARVDGNARFEVGQVVLVFVKEHQGRHYTVGMELGKFDVHVGADNRRYVRRATTVPVAALVRRGEVEEMDLRDADTSYEGASLDRMLADIEKILARTPAQEDRK